MKKARHYGSDPRVLQAQHKKQRPAHCLHSNLPVDLRLAGGSTSMAGRLELSYLGIWGTVRWQHGAGVVLPLRNSARCSKCLNLLWPNLQAAMLVGRMRACHLQRC